MYTLYSKKKRPTNLITGMSSKKSRNRNLRDPVKTKETYDMFPPKLRTPKKKAQRIVTATRPGQKKPTRGWPSEFRTPLPLLSMDRTFGDFGGSIVSRRVAPLR